MEGKKIRWKQIVLMQVKGCENIEEINIRNVCDDARAIQLKEATSHYTIKND